MNWKLLGFLPIFFVFVWLVAFFAGPFLLIIFPLVVISLWKNPGQRKPTRLPLPLFLFTAGAGITFFFAAVTAPIRAIALLTQQCIPPLKAIPLNIPLDILGVNFFRSTALGPWIEFFWGSAGVLFAVVGGMADGFWRFKLLQMIQSLPTAKCRSVALGLAELRGVVRADDPNLPAIRFLRGGGEMRKPFCLEDETGAIRVDSEGAKLRTAERFSFGGLFNEIILTYNVTRDGAQDKPRSGELRDGQKIYVLGYVEQNTAGNPPYVIRPRRSEVFDLDPRNLFFMTDAGDATARDYIKRGMVGAFCISLAWMLLSTFLALHGLENTGLNQH